MPAKDGDDDDKDDDDKDDDDKDDDDDGDRDDNNDDDDDDDDKPVDGQWLRKCLDPWQDPSLPLSSQFRFGSLTPFHS